MSTDPTTDADADADPETAVEDVDLAVDDTTLFEAAPQPANGDPFVAMLLNENDNGVAVDRTLVSLGTGFDSLEAIAAHLRDRLNGDSPSNDTFDLEFVPTRAEIFGIAGSVSFETPPRPFAVSIDGDVYAVTASTQTDARYRAAAQHKEALGGPEVGLSIDDYAAAATILDDSND